MKLIRYGTTPSDVPKYGAADNQGYVRVIPQQLSTDTHMLLQTTKVISTFNSNDLPVVARLNELHLFPCVPIPNKLICIAFNSQLHGQQMGEHHCDEPIFFFKATSAICGANTPIIYPKIAEKVDWEAELGVIIGKKAKYVTRGSALEHVLGYCCAMDISDRGWQKDHPGKQLTKGKSFDTFAPIGPYLVTKEEVNNPNNLRVHLKVNGKLRQNFSTKDYHFSVEEIVSFLSQFFTLEPGDIIFMGSGPGTACMWDNQYLAIGDIVEMEIDQLGGQVKRVVSET